MSTEIPPLNLLGRMKRLVAARSQQVALRAVNKMLHPLECALVANQDSQSDCQPIFIIGAPRSGSTLIYQALVNCLEVSYLSNLHALLYGMPTLVERWYDARTRDDKIKFQSHLGKTQGWHAPSECGEFWYRFYQRNLLHAEGYEISEKSLQKLICVVAQIAATRKRPLLFKNLQCSLRLPSLARAFPQALFLIVRRNEMDNAHSLLAARQSHFGDYAKWFSVKPPGVEALDELPPHQQVIEQIRGISTYIDRQRTSIGEDRFLEIAYEGFCDAPTQSIDGIRKFTRQHGLELAVTEKSLPPFRRCQSVSIDLGLYKKMVTYARAA